MSETKRPQINKIVGKLPLLTSVCCLTLSVGSVEASPVTSQNSFKQQIAQAETEKTIETKPVVEESAVENKNTLEKTIISELNRVRTNPKEYADWLESQKQYYQGMLVKLPGEKPIRTNRGLRSLEEAIAFLRQQEALPPLSTSTQLNNSAQQRIDNITNNQKISNRNNLVYGKVTPEAIVMQLVIDDGFPDRPHRLAIFNQNYQNTGIVCSEIPVYTNVCAIAYTEDSESTAEIAQKPSEVATANNDDDRPNVTESKTKPETSVTANDRLPAPPDANTPLPTTESEAVVATENDSVTNSATETNPPQSPENASTTSTTETETSEKLAISSKPTLDSEGEVNNTETDTTVETPSSQETATAPTPDSQQQANNTQTDTTVETPSSAETANAPTPDSQQQANNTQTDTTVETPSSQETATAPTPNSQQQANNTQTDTTVETPSSAETATAPTPNSQQQANNTESESDANSSVGAVEIVEIGKLEEGDEVIPNDGSFYDSYPLDGSAGDSFVITLESKDFDTFLAVMDREGNIIEQNDDANEEESNSRLEITLPDSGTYSVIVNAYDSKGVGNYTLKVIR